MLPVAVYGLEVPSGDRLTPAVPNFPATFRVTMAAIDPRQFYSPVKGAASPSTLKLVREPIDDDDESDEDYDDVDAIRARLAGAISDEEDEDEESEEDEEDSDEEKNGGPSDPARTKKARKEAAMREIKKLLEEEEEMDLDNAPNGVNGTKANKGKGKATDLDEDSSEDEDLEREMEEFVICTLDEKTYQQPLDITVGENERVYFKVSGMNNIFLTGNYVLPPDHDHDDEDYDSEEDMDYDLSPDEDELDDEDEEDALDGLQDPRITEVDTDDEEKAPKLVTADKKKGKNKRPADESDDEDQADTLDNLISKSLKPAEPATNGDQKLSKKQLKKLKKNDGEAVTTAEEAPAKKGKKDQKEPHTSGKTDKKVQFAKDLEQGPTGSPKADVKKDAGKKEESPKTGLGVKVINDVTIDDKKLGKGPAAKKGDKVGMRYIGKLTNGKVFDSNKKGKPFSFKLGVGEVIKGWDIGVAGMTVGGERRITIPAKLAYGSKSMPSIPPNSDLVFDIKMMSVN